MSNLVGVSRQPADEGTREARQAGRSKVDIDPPFEVVSGAVDETVARRAADRGTGRPASDRNPGRSSADDNPERRSSSSEAARRASEAPAARAGTRRRAGEASRAPAAKAQAQAAPVATTSAFAKLGSQRVAMLGALGLVIVLVGAVAGYVVSSASPDRYGARAEVYYEISQEKSTGFLREDRSLTTQLVLARSRAVLTPVAEANGMTVEELADGLSVELLGSSEVIRFQMEDGSADRALLLVNGVVDEYLALTREEGTDTARKYLEEQLTELQTAIDAQRAEIDALVAQATNPEDGKVLAASAELQSLLARQDATVEEIDQLTVGQLTQQRIDLLTEGYVLDSPVSPRPKLAAVTGGLAAAILAAVIVAVVGRRWARR